jgi:hypothetical protein
MSPTTSLRGEDVGARQRVLATMGVDVAASALLLPVTGDMVVWTAGDSRRTSCPITAGEPSCVKRGGGILC